MSQNDEQTDKQRRVLRLITWMFLVVMPIAYLMAAQQIDAKGVQARAGNDVLLYLLLVVGALSPLMIPLVTNSVIRGERAKKGQGLPPAQIFQQLSIVQMAFVEAIYIYGFIVFNLTGKFTYMLYFYPIGIVWSFVYWPKREKYDRLLEKLKQP